MDLKPLVIGKLKAKFPIIQGGMGVGISLSRLAGAVAKEGGIGIISAAQTGFATPEFEKNPLAANLKALAQEIKQAKQLSDGGIIGVNIMRASQNYEDYVQCVVDSGADLIISGAGLPLTLPALLKNTQVCFAPIVSSLKAVQVLFKTWQKKYQACCDFVVIEGPKAGGHLGFSLEYLQSAAVETFDKEVSKIVEYVKEFSATLDKHIPVVFAGGVFDQRDIAHYLALGCDGVQMATRFVATEECDAAEEYKQAYINCTREDVAIVKSPVGMPGRAITNPFIENTKKGRIPPKKCYHCIQTCVPAETPYCITNALVAAAKGDVKNGLLFCGENAYKVDKMSTVHEIFLELTK